MIVTKIGSTSSTTMAFCRVISTVITTAAVFLMMNGGNGDSNLLFVQGSDITAASNAAATDGRKTTTLTSTVRRRRVPVELVDQEIDGGDADIGNQNNNRHRELDASDLDLDFRLLLSSPMSMDIEMKQVFFTAKTTPLAGGDESTVESETTLFIPQWKGLSEMATPNDVVCFVGSADNLEKDIDSVHGGGDGTQCSAANGCGVHVHTGTSCENTDTQGKITQNILLDSIRFMIRLPYFFHSLELNSLCLCITVNISPSF